MLKKWNQRSRFAGGAIRSADIVEHINDFGYEHLIPPRMNNKIPWWVKYDVDIYLFYYILPMTLILIVYRWGYPTTKKKKE